MKCCGTYHKDTSYRIVPPVPFVKDITNKDGSLLVEKSDGSTQIITMSSELSNTLDIMNATGETLVATVKVP